jgi:hypothetical protein
LVKAFLFGLFIFKREDNIVLTASTEATSVNISGLTYHSALALYGNQPIRPATKLRLTYKKMFIVNKVSIVGLKAFV